MKLLTSKKYIYIYIFFVSMYLFDIHLSVTLNISYSLQQSCEMELRNNGVLLSAAELQDGITKQRSTFVCSHGNWRQHLNMSSYVGFTMAKKIAIIRFSMSMVFIFTT